MLFLMSMMLVMKLVYLKDYKKESREKVQRMQREFSENWYKSAGAHRVENRPNGKSEMKELVSVYTPYEPLELE